MDQPISITAISSISSLGTSSETAWMEYQKPNNLFQKMPFGDGMDWVASFSNMTREEIEQIKLSDPKYKSLDPSVLYALFASRKAMKEAGWEAKDNFGINIGSSRGATTLFEKYHQEFIDRGNTATLASPTTTLGNISSWVAHDLQTKGPEISHSITCSTALHSLLNGIAWLKSGMADKFLVGGSEAPLTPFTIAQMKALKIYAKISEEQYPCRALDLTKDKNSMVLGEGASVACLEKGIPKNALAIIEGIGYATEALTHNISISTEANCFQRSMQMALGDTPPQEVNAIVMHAPGTIKGDLSEIKAIEKVFENHVPALTTNKWKIGHTFGASGMLSIEMAIFMLQYQQFIPVPFIDYKELPAKMNSIMVNAVGFGGNAVSILLKRP